MAGVDFRYGGQRLNEIDTLAQSGFQLTQNFPIPRSHIADPGVFVETQFKANDSLTVRSGARLDWVSTNADENVPGAARNLEEALMGEFDQHFDLWAAFVTLEQQLSDGWTATAGAGHSERPPTMTELYADEPFLAVMPQFLFNSPSGNPNLDPERLWQIDLGLRYQSDCVRGGISGFHGWIQDYITFDASPTTTLTDPTQTPLNFTWVNTELATLAGAEAHLELDWTDMVTTFVRLTYIEGRDLTHDWRATVQFARTTCPAPRAAPIPSGLPQRRSRYQSCLPLKVIWGCEFRIQRKPNGGKSNC